MGGKKTINRKLEANSFVHSDLIYYNISIDTGISRY